MFSTQQKKKRVFTFLYQNILLWPQKQQGLFLQNWKRKGGNGQFLNDSFLGRYEFPILLTSSRFWWGVNWSFESAPHTSPPPNTQCRVKASHSVSLLLLCTSWRFFPGRDLDNAELSGSCKAALKCVVRLYLWAFDVLL